MRRIGSSAVTRLHNTHAHKHTNNPAKTDNTGGYNAFTKKQNVSKKHKRTTLNPEFGSFAPCTRVTTALTVSCGASAWIAPLATRSVGGTIESSLVLIRTTARLQPDRTELKLRGHKQASVHSGTFNPELGSLSAHDLTTIVADT